MVMQNLANLAPNLTKMLGGFRPGAPAASGVIPFKAHVGVTDGDAAYNTTAEVIAIIGAMAAGPTWVKIWELTVPAQQQLAWGFGSPALPHNQGYMWFCSLDVNADFQVGVLRLVQCNARETLSRVVLEVDDTRLHGTTVTTLATATPTNINEMIALPEKVEFPLVGEDSKLQLWYRCITAATAEDGIGFSIPITVRQ